MKISLIICTLICSLAMHAQEYATLKGKITDNELGDAPLAFAQISLGGSDIRAESDLQGHYLIKDLVPGEYKITIAFPGYQTVRKTISISEQETADLNISMDALLLKREEVLRALDQ